MPATHERIEKSPALLIVLVLITVAIGGLVEIVPLFFQKSTTEPVKGLQPYTALQLAGRDVYVREGCYTCHSQMIGPFLAEKLRYGDPSRVEDSRYDHPFQWGSKRTGPDLARVGGRYSDEWHQQHLKNPQSVVPESVMPQYAFLADHDLDAGDMKANLTALSRVGVPYSKEDIAKANDDLKAQADPMSGTDLAKRYPKAQVRDFDGDPKRLTEMDALIAYLQVLGTMVDVNAPAAQEDLAKEKGR